MEKEHLASQRFLQIMAQHSPHLSELAENQRLVACCQDLFEHLFQAGQFT